MSKAPPAKGVGQGLMAFFAKKPAPASSGTPSSEEPAAGGKRPLPTGSEDDEPASKRTEAPIRQLPAHAAAMDAMDVEQDGELPLSAIGRKASASIIAADDDSEEEAARKA
ncbi:hypothetical protein Ctob_008504 [Chrysochromulina tobinii]|uniref:Uncharacterized protein n=1 Tax=Chrysochromulina tobinii TaxID=1460289 RepID=A0A0M0JKX2_9EUKA|nr:hypothetical protein Ctob_008504 [Chrysochromulina tobinii]|eukprot:KOO27229.1 hypothetical protein Ctob_008504 [Chrysochromulina sp. CCMP291]